MKKRLIIILSAALIIGTTVYFSIINNFGNRINCTSNSNNNGIKIEQSYNIRYFNNAILDVKLTKGFTYDDPAAFDGFKSVMVPKTDESMSGLENQYINFTSKTTDTSYFYTLNAEVQNLTDDEITAIGLDRKLSELTTSLVNQGLVCK